MSDWWLGVLLFADVLVENELVDEVDKAVHDWHQCDKNHNHDEIEDDDFDRWCGTAKEGGEDNRENNHINHSNGGDHHDIRKDAQPPERKPDDAIAQNHEVDH